MYNISIEFEFDPFKSQLNEQKHGISFEEAKLFWTEFGVRLSARSGGEEREMRIVKFYNKYFTCVFTMRGNRIRIISVRRSREKEKQFYQETLEYEQETQKDFS